MARIRMQAMYAKIRILLFCLTVGLPIAISARPIQPGQAKKVAARWLADAVKVSDDEVQIVYTHTDTQTGIVAFYAVNVGSHAFVLVSADDVAKPVLGYSTEGKFNAEDIPSNILWFYDDLAAQIGAAVSDCTEQNEEYASLWAVLTMDYHIPQEGDFLYTTTVDSVGPLLTTKWGQGVRYNELCPTDSNGTHAVTGCVATAMAQIINYWGYPTRGRGTHSYHHDTFGTLSADFENTIYDYDHMPSYLNYNSTPQEITAVATLMRNCGIAINMNYGINASAGSGFNSGLFSFFRYSSGMQDIVKSNYTSNEWDIILRSELAMGRPISYGGGPHEFVCDGYKQNGYFHFNFGWQGSCDGWYLSSAIDMPCYSYGFNNGQTATINIVPDSTSNVIRGVGGTSSFFVDQPLLYYTFVKKDTVIFLPTVDTLQLLVDYSSDTTFADASIFDGNGTGNLVGTTSWNSIDFASIVSQSHAFTLVTPGGSVEKDHFFIISPYTGCRKISDLSATVDQNIVHLEWQENGTSSQWEIEYGMTGFEYGTGNVLTVDTNSTYIATQIPGTYDFYVRPICEIDDYPRLTKITATTHSNLPYWTDIVTSEPSGFFVDNNGDVTISTAEGLAWLSRIVNGLNSVYVSDFNNKTITLANDIDLDGYQWYPIGTSNTYPFKGTFNGRGHKIMNLFIDSDDFPYTGLFGFVYNGDLTNCCLADGSITNYYNASNTNGTGGLVGELANGNIINCHSSIQITGSYHVGGLCGELLSGMLTNCSCNSTVTGYNETGGLIGYCHATSITNSFAKGAVVSDNLFAGGISGWQSSCLLQNCYATNNIFSRYSGLNGRLFGRSADVSVNNAFIINDNSNISWLGFEYGSCYLSDTARFNLGGWDCSLTTPIVINNESYDSLSAALNAWVDANDPNGTTYRHWEADVTGENGGFPIFACLTSTDSDYIAVCNSYLWNGSVYTTDTILTDTLRSDIGCDSIVTHYITINHPADTAITESSCKSYTYNGHTYTESGNYQHTFTSTAGCDSIVTLNLTILPLPTPNISGNTVICEGETSTLTANGGVSYVWNNAATTNSISVSQSGVFTVTATNAEGCSATANVTVTVNPLPSVNITGNNSFCQGDNVTLTATGASTYAWSNASSNAAVTVTNAGTYTVTGTDANGCTNTATKTVAVNPTYNIPLTHSICQGESYNFHGQNLTTAGTYTHTLQTVNGCDSVLTLTLTVKALPTPTIVGNTSLCEGETSTLTANGGISYVWSNAATANSISVSQSGIYTVIATNAEGCSAPASVTVTVNPPPTITITGNTTICAGSSTTLTATGADSYSWSTSDNTASVSISAFGIYTVTGTTTAGCSGTAEVTVLVSQLPVISITGETDICAGESTTLTANGGETYLWSDGTTGNTLTVNLAGTYQVIGYNAAGCYSIADATVSVWQPATSEFTIECPDSCYIWNGESYCQSGDYTQTLQTIHGCDSVVTLHLTITVGVDDFDGFDFKVYPNPTSSVVNVQCTMNNVQVETVEIWLYDAYGKLVNVAAANNEGIAQIDLSRYAPGIYIIKAVADGNVVAVRKVVKR